jgi:8-oxo-dGTP pyrophosphatase MutT (NUDIX family)
MEIYQKPMIRIAAALIDDDRGRLLLVRKVGTPWFMQAGGKIEHGESAISALDRELREEIGHPSTKIRVLPGLLFGPGGQQAGSFSRSRSLSRSRFPCAHGYFRDRGGDLD